MRKRTLEKDISEEPPKKKTSTMTTPQNVDIKPGEILTDITGQTWKLGKAIGQGGFGEIFLVSDKIDEDVTSDAKYVAKIESFQNGPLFVEINCYLRMGKEEMIKNWKEEKGLKNLGVPHYVASGSHEAKGGKYRFLILPRFSNDLEEILIAKKNKFNLKTVLTIAYQIIDILEYIHSKGIVHSDIKASNILLQSKKKQNSKKNLIKKAPLLRYHGSTPLRTCKVRKMTCITRTLRLNCNLRSLSGSPADDVEEEEPSKEKSTSKDQIYLLDYGLASRFIKESGHRLYGRDERKAHAGTILFCSLDAHIGSPSRRSDLECLGYNLIYWLTGTLPWIDDIEDPIIVEKKKKRCLIDLKIFLNICFDQCPRFIYDYFKYLGQLDFEAKPDYDYLKKLFKNAIKQYGYQDDSVLDFDNLEGWGRKQKKTKRNSENFKVTKLIRQNFKRAPLQSNLPIKPLLRKKIKKSKLNWSKILLDPELILKTANKERERKMSDTIDPSSLENMDIKELKPTYHMVNVYNRYMDKVCNANGCSPRSSTEVSNDNPDGYTAPMIEILNKIKEREELEYEEPPVFTTKVRKRKLASSTKFSPRKTRSSKSTAKDSKRGKKYHLRG